MENADIKRCYSWELRPFVAIKLIAAKKETSRFRIFFQSTHLHISSPHLSLFSLLWSLIFMEKAELSYKSTADWHSKSQTSHNEKAKRVIHSSRRFLIHTFDLSTLRSGCGIAFYERVCRKPLQNFHVSFNNLAVLKQVVKVPQKTRP